MNKHYLTDKLEFTAKDANTELSLNKVFVIKGTANSGMKDRSADIMPRSCWDLENFKKNPILLYGHNYEAPLGRIVEIYPTETGLKFVAELGHVDAEMTELQKNTIKLLQQGILNTFSVGFIGHDYDYDKQNGVYIYTKAELLEISLVAVPMDANATLDNFYQKQLRGVEKMEEVKKELSAIKEGLLSITEEIKKLSSINEDNKVLNNELTNKTAQITELELLISKANELI